MFGRILTGAAVAAAMVVCGAPAAHAGDSLVCDPPVLYAGVRARTSYVVGELNTSSPATAVAHWACANADTGAVYYMTGTLTAYAYSGGYYRMVDQAGLSVRAIAGAASVNMTMSSSSAFQTWDYVRFDGWAMGRHVVATAPVSVPAV